MQPAHLLLKQARIQGNAPAIFHGLLTLMDRSKGLIISRGSDIYPREVEAVLLVTPGLAAAGEAP